MRVLIIKSAELSDILLALPILGFLQHVSPGIEIDWIVEEQYADILVDDQAVSRLFTISAKNWRLVRSSVATVREILSLKAELSARRYTIVFDLQGTLESGLIAKLTGCSRRYGFDGDRVPEAANLRFITNAVPLRKQDQHQTDRALRLVSVPFGKDYQGVPFSTGIATKPDDDRSAELFLATLLDGLVFIFQPGAPSATRMWYDDGWKELGRALLDRFPDATILISWGDAKERSRAEKIASGIGRQTRLLPHLSLKEFAALLKKVDLVVGGDTDPVQLAFAVGTPTVSFYRATDGTLHGPRGEMHRIIQSQLPCTKCCKQTCDKDASCCESITVQAMLTAIDELLSQG